jgi:excisionase family DNA binding protein
MNTEVLTMEEAADLLRLGSGTVRRLVQRGELPGRKFGQQWRFSRQALLSLLEQPPSDQARVPLASPSGDPLTAALVAALAARSPAPDPTRYQPLTDAENVSEGTEEEEAAVWAALSKATWE